MKLVSFLLPSPMGSQIRTGAIDAAGGIVDLAGAFRALLVGEGLPQEAAVRISEALLPGHMVALIEGGERSLDAARRAIQWAADEGPTVALSSDSRCAAPVAPRSSPNSFQLGDATLVP